jgi:aldose 1-epimerase
MTVLKRLLVLLVSSALAHAATVARQSFGHLADGREVTLYTLQAKSGLRADIMDFGGTVVRLLAPDRNGKLADVVLGFDHAADYATKSPYFGALIGRVGNRIANGSFALAGKTYTLPTNNKPGGHPCTLHGGTIGFDKVFWHAEPAECEGEPALKLEYTSRDGENGFPGNLEVQVVYSLTKDNALRIDYRATTDQPTPVNLTNHSYFNLQGEGADTVLGHQLTLHARRYTPVDVGLIPTGELAPVAGTPFDFTRPHAIGERIGQDNSQLGYAHGYDHNFVLDADAGTLALAASVYEPTSGRVLEVLTTEPGLQFYSGNFLNGTLTGKSGKSYRFRSALALETQHFPDSVHHPDFPNILLRPGQVYRSTTVYRFSTR